VVLIETFLYISAVNINSVAVIQRLLASVPTFDFFILSSDSNYIA